MQTLSRWSVVSVVMVSLAFLWGGLHCAPPGSSEASPETPTVDGGSTSDQNAQNDQAPPTDKGSQTDQSTAPDQGTPDTPAPPEKRNEPAQSDQGTADQTPDATQPEPTPEPQPEPSPEPTPERTTPPKAGLLYVAQTKAITTFQVAATTRRLSRSANLTRTGALRFLAFHPNKKYIYAMNQNRVEAFARQPGAKGALKAIGSAVSGENGTHLDVDQTGKYVFVASYGGNQVSMLPIGSNGVPKAPTYKKGGKSNTSFCHKAHQVRVHPDNRFVYVPCLGSDHILVLGFNAQTGKITQKPAAKTPKGAGPRHLDFHPNKGLLYVVNESKSSVIAFKINRTTGQLTRLQEITTLPKGTNTPSRSSDIHVSPDGKFVLAVNREPLNNIAMFSVAADGKLRAIGHVSTGGVHARTFAFGPRGEYLYIGNTRSKSLVVLKQSAPNKWVKHSQQSFPTDVWFVGFLEP